ncbi:MAG: membrane-bound lytic murein transglycosylase MltF [Gammaproteobacteria bacterium]|nr:MAG: membrane-bound lytic murein transglycosylase MltF [Gammaproteobacteria bacterium]
MNIKQALIILADRDHKFSLRILFSGLLLVIFSILYFGISKTNSTSHIEQIKNRGTLNVITRSSPTTFYIGYQGPEGVEYQLASRFAEHLGVELEITSVDSISDIFIALQTGKADLAAAGLSITPERELNFTFSPAYQEVSQKLVFKQGKRWPRNINQLNGELRVMAGSSHAQKLLDLKQHHAGLSWTETVNNSSEDLLAKVLDESIDYTISDSNELALNRRFYPELAIGFSIGEPEQIAWAFKKSNDEGLRAEAIKFFGEFRKSGELAHLMERHYGHVEDFDYVGTREFLAAAQTKLTKYLDTFHKAAGDMDWRLLAAIGYQESHWNPRARSPTGVRGIMMLTLNTAKHIGVKNRLDAEQSIMGGAKYFKIVLKRIPARIPEPDRTWFALASYNIGWGHVEDARILTERQGADPDRWVDVKERLPLLRQRKYYKQTRYGYARGNEPVQYVDNIRRYYETLQWISDEVELEAQSSKTMLAEQSTPVTKAPKQAPQDKPAVEEAQTEN